MYSELFLNKASITKVTYKDLVDFFSTEKEESDKIEFKSFYSDNAHSNSIAEKEKGILRTICAFLNSEGGLLIWGAPIGSKVSGKREKVFIGDLSMVEVLYEKDAFIGKIANKITPTPKGILFHRIEHESKYVYLFEVSKSEYSPHQLENTYLMRLDGQTVPAPHHYIEALFKKVSFPNLEAFLVIDDYVYVLHDTDKAILRCKVVFRNLTRFQNDYNVQYRVLSWCGVSMAPDIVVNNLPTEPGPGQNGFYVRENVIDVIYFGAYVYDSFKILLSRETLHSINYTFKLLITFGAKDSPLKQCLYNIKVGPTLPKNIQDCLIEIDENKYFHEGEQIDAETDFNNLNIILKRNRKYHN